MMKLLHDSLSMMKKMELVLGLCNATSINLLELPEKA